MKNNDDILVFDEDEAVKYIYNFIPAELKTRISTDDIDYVLDIMYEFYEENGFIDEDSTEEASIDEEDMFAYILKNIQKDKVVKLSENDLQLILEGEFEYGKSIGVYKED